MSKGAEKIAYHYIIKNQKIHGGEPIIKNTRFPVRSVVFYIIKQGMLPEELAQEFPQLSLAAIHEALSYYYENKEEIEDLIEKIANHHAKNKRKALWDNFIRANAIAYVIKKNIKIIISNQSSPDDIKGTIIWLSNYK